MGSELIQQAADSHAVDERCGPEKGRACSSSLSYVLKLLEHRVRVPGAECSGWNLVMVGARRGFGLVFSAPRFPGEVENLRCKYS
jgi:hypothetical protein